MARRKLAYGGPRASRTPHDLGKASYVTSVFGIVVAVAVAAILAFVLLTLVSRQLVSFCMYLRRRKEVVFSPTVCMYYKT